MPLVPRSGNPKRSLKARRKTVPRVWLLDSVHVVNPKGTNKLRFTFTRDIIDRLIAAHMKLYDAFYWNVVDRTAMYRQYRLQYVRFADLRVPAVFVMIEPPTFDPRGKRLHRISNNQFYSEIVATKLKVNPERLHAHRAEHYWAEQGLGGLNGVVINLPDEAMVYDGPKLPFKQSGVKETDLVVY